MVEGLAERLEVHQQVDIAFGLLLAPDKRPEQSDPPDSQGPYPCLILSDEPEDVLFRPDAALHFLSPPCGIGARSSVGQSDTTAPAAPAPRIRRGRASP